MGIVVIFIILKNLLIIQKAFTEHLPAEYRRLSVDMLLHAVKLQPNPSDARSLACFYQ